MRKYILISMVLLVLQYNPANAQFSGNSLVEYQLGNIPETDPKDASTIYGQFNLNYRWKSLKASTRIENFYSTVPERSQYTQFTQYSLNFTKKGFKVKAGNFYETLGKGLLYRGFEIKNSILEDQVYRVRRSFFRDTRGIFGGYSNKDISIKILHGNSLSTELPPTFDDNRVDQATASEIKVRIKNQRVGAIYLYNDSPAEKAQYMSFSLEGDITQNLGYYGEYAHRVDGQKFFGHEKEDGYGGYFNLNYATSGFGASVEIKDYHNLFIGSGISDPPTLVKEHYYRLLNRSTHVTNLVDERGFQVEAFFVPRENQLLTFNTSKAINQFGDTKFVFNEYFLEWSIELKDERQLKVFGDYSSDNLLLEKNRYATGIYYTQGMAKNWSFSIESEAQQIEREFSEKENLYNVYMGFIVNKTTKFSGAFIWEFTTDPVVADLQQTEKIEESRHYLSVAFTYKPNRKNTFSLFAGNRRGGPACTSGICYEVLDFKGVELHWAMKL